MPKILFIVPYPHQSAPSQRFRFEQYEDWLKESGYEISYAPFFDDKTWQFLYQEGHFLKKGVYILRSFWKRWVLLFQLKQYDHLFIHREMAPLGPPIFEWIVAKLFKRKYIYDFDDAIWLPNYSEANSKFQRIKMYWKVNYCMKWASKITAGNAYLAEYARKYNSSVQIIPTTIDTENYHNCLTNHDEDQLIIGWTGSHSTMKYLDVIVPVLKKIEKKYSFKLRIISDKNPNFDLNSLEFIKWNKETEIQDLSKLHIGLMPLEEDVWSEGKCGFKGLQYMSLGIATVMSPIGVNKTIIEHGVNGFLVSDLNEWEDVLVTLIEQKALRKEIGLKGRDTVEKFYSVHSQKKHYLDLFTVK